MMPKKMINSNIIYKHYKEYCALYPPIGHNIIANDALKNFKPSQVSYIDYNYSTENYQRALQYFSDYLSAYLEDNHQVSFLFLSEVMQDSQLNRKRQFVVGEHKYDNLLFYNKKGFFSFTGNKIAKYAHFNITNYTIPIDLLTFLFDNHQRVFIINSDNKVDLDNDIHINSDCTKIQYDYIDFLGLDNNIKIVSILYGGFDFGQLALVMFQKNG